MRNGSRRLVGLAWFLFVLVFISGTVAAAYFLTGYLYGILHWQPPRILIQIINTLFGLLLGGSLVGAIGNLARSLGWAPERNIFAPILDALERIARGDFSVRLTDEHYQNPMVGELSDSVNKMATELHQWESMRQEFISNVSHEIQSPLTSIRGFAKALENDRLTVEERQHYLSVIDEESLRLSRITEDLLKLASLESDQLKLEAKTYRLDKQIRDLILACEPQWQMKKIKMKVTLAELEITADEDLLSQVWNNLIHNSIKFTPQAGAINVSLSGHSDQIVAKISDTGIGISDEDRARIFERFYKADKSRPRTTEGSGLGLSIAKKIIDLHSGSIEVESKLGQGTTFTVALPRRPAR